MSRKQLFTVLTSLMVTTLSLATPSTSKANPYCAPAQVCVSSCEASEVVMTCKEYAADACIFLSAECWENVDGTDPYCNSAGYSRLICYYSI